MALFRQNGIGSKEAFQIALDSRFLPRPGLPVSPEPLELRTVSICIGVESLSQRF